MSTVRELGEKYGGIIAEFVTRCDEEEKNPETIVEETELLKGLVSNLKENGFLTELQAKYSCSEKLYEESKLKAKETIVDAIKKGDLKRVKDIYSSWIDLRKDSYDVTGMKGWSYPFENYLLELACKNGRLEIVKWILEIKPTINYKNTLLFYSFEISCENGHLDFAKWLFEINPDIYKKCSGLKSIFVWTCENGQLEVAKWLLKVILDIDLEEKVAFRLACKHGHLKIAQWLLEKV